MQEITVVLDESGTSVTVRGDAVYTGTQTPGNSMGGRNIETYDVVIQGVECRGEWDGDGRNRVTVDPCPSELRPLVAREAAAQEYAAEMREWNRLSAADRQYYSACGMEPKRS